MKNFILLLTLGFVLTTTTANACDGDAKKAKASKSGKAKTECTMADKKQCTKEMMGTAGHPGCCNHAKKSNEAKASTKADAKKSS